MDLNIRKVTDSDKLFYFERNFFTLDGLWMIETEKEVGWDAAIKIDLDVWIRLLKIIFRRLKRHLNIETNDLKDLAEILAFRWTIEGWKYKITESDDKVTFEMRACPYMEGMSRNPDRHTTIPKICNQMCKPFYSAIIEEFNPEIKLSRENFMGLGDELCNFTLSKKK